MENRLDILDITVSLILVLFLGFFFGLHVKGKISDAVTKGIPQSKEEIPQSNISTSTPFAEYPFAEYKKKAREVQDYMRRHKKAVQEMAEFCGSVENVWTCIPVPNSRSKDGVCGCYDWSKVPSENL